ncbi:MAG: hypothetical protein QNJ78_08445 [Gammaproteobacteria bacterium]|nr:hypothetical protein [Gammaproteobacteria bacterium]
MNNNYFNPIRLLTAACVCTALTLPVSSAIAKDRDHHGRAEAVSPDEVVAGMNYGGWGAAWWQWAVSIPIEDNPLTASKDTNCSEGQGSSPVFFIGGAFGAEDEVIETPAIFEITRECVVPVGSHIFFPIINAITHNANEDDLIEVEAAQREDVASSISNLVDVDSLEVTVDGKKVEDAENLSDFRAQSPNLPFTLPEGNVFEDPPGRYHGTADGYWMMLEPLSPGEHVVRFLGNAVYEGEVVFGLDITYYLTVE